VRLASVAYAYEAGRAEGGSYAAGVRAVKDHLLVSRPQAYRLVARAIEAGLIEPTSNQEDQ
jgi:hypothetical protein